MFQNIVQCIDITCCYKLNENQEELSGNEEQKLNATKWEYINDII